MAIIPGAIAIIPGACSYLLVDGAITKRLKELVVSIAMAIILADWLARTLQVQVASTKR